MGKWGGWPAQRRKWEARPRVSGTNVDRRSGTDGRRGSAGSAHAEWGRGREGKVEDEAEVIKWR